jgi:hypothetical protein
VENFDILGFGEAEKIVQVGYNEAQRTMLPWINERAAHEAWAGPNGSGSN